MIGRLLDLRIDPLGSWRRSDILPLGVTVYPQPPPHMHQAIDPLCLSTLEIQMEEMIYFRFPRVGEQASLRVARVRIQSHRQPSKADVRVLRKPTEP